MLDKKSIKHHHCTQHTVDEVEMAAMFAATSRPASASQFNSSSGAISMRDCRKSFWRMDLSGSEGVQQDLGPLRTGLSAQSSPNCSRALMRAWITESVYLRHNLTSAAKCDVMRPRILMGHVSDNICSTSIRALIPTDGV